MMDLKDLEPLLQRSYNNRDLQVIDYTATKLLPAGENFGSIMVKIDAKIRKNKNAKEEMLYLVGKTPSQSEIAIINWPVAFEKECFLYTELYPLYRELEREVGIDEKNLINVLPDFIGFRYSLKDNAEPDDDSVLLIENLMKKGFYLADKRTGVDVHHAKVALTSLARYHALGIAMKQKRPSFAKKAIEQARKLGIEFSHLDNSYVSTLEVFAQTPSMKKHLTTFEKLFEDAKCGGPWKGIPTEPWATINHGDFWTNNMLFHKDDEGHVDDIRFVDFQTYIYYSPLKDVSRLIGCGLDVETQANHLEELFDLYYDVFIKTLTRMNCDTTAFTRESYDREVKKEALGEFAVCTLASKFFVTDNFDEKQSNEENITGVINAKPSKAYIDKLMWIVEVYERMKWL